MVITCAWKHLDNLKYVLNIRTQAGDIPIDIEPTYHTLSYITLYNALNLVNDSTDDGMYIADATNKMFKYSCHRQEIGFELTDENISIIQRSLNEIKDHMFSTLSLSTSPTITRINSQTIIRCANYTWSIAVNDDFLDRLRGCLTTQTPLKDIKSYHNIPLPCSIMSSVLNHLMQQQVKYPILVN